MTIAETLRKAAEVMKERGKCEYHYEDRRGRVCLYGAIRLAECGNVEREGEFASEVFLREYCADRYGMGIAAFNDDGPDGVPPGLLDCLALYEDAAKQAEMEGK